MAVTAGSRLGPCEIVSPLGAGGMGEVYRARDPRLGREVAIKVLPASFSADADRLRRFEQEARAAGILNHPQHHRCLRHRNPRRRPLRRPGVTRRRDAAHGSVRRERRDLHRRPEQVHVRRRADQVRVERQERDRGRDLVVRSPGRDQEVRQRQAGRRQAAAALRRRRDPVGLRLPRVSRGLIGEIDRDYPLTAPRLAETGGGKGPRALFSRRRAAKRRNAV